MRKETVKPPAAAAVPVAVPARAARPSTWWIGPQGAGTEESPYLISSVNEWNTFVTNISTMVKRS